MINRENYDNLRIDNHISLATYYRFLLLDVLPTEIEHLLYLDADTIIMSELSMLDEVNKQAPYFLYAANHQFNKVPAQALKYNPELKSYFNAGVLLMNLHEIRKSFSARFFIEFGLNHKDDLIFHDQDILNIHFGGKWNPLPERYNVFEKLANRIADPIIVHYTGNRKPWNWLCDNPHRDKCWHYLKMTPFFTGKMKLKYYAGFFINPVFSMVKKMMRRNQQQEL